MLRYRYAKDSPKHEYLDRHYCGVAEAFHSSKNGNPYTFPACLIVARARYERPGIALEVRGFKTEQGDDVFGPVGCTEKGARVWKTGILQMKAGDKPMALLTKKLNKARAQGKYELVESLINEAKQRGIDINSDSVS